jgi:hypothetical protein
MFLDGRLGRIIDWDAARRGTGCQRHENALLNWGRGRQDVRGDKAPSQHVCASKSFADQSFADQRQRGSN